MSVNFNKVILAGNLTRDPAVRFLAGEKQVAEFGLAINRKWKDASGAAKEEVTFVDVSTWGRTAELVGQYLKKGSGAMVEGRLKLDSWDDKATGAKRSKLTVVADTVQFTDSLAHKGGGEAPADGAAAAPPADAPARAPRAPRPPPAAGGGAGDDEPPF